MSTNSLNWQTLNTSGRNRGWHDQSQKVAKHKATGQAKSLTPGLSYQMRGEFNMEKKENLWDKEFWTQSEVANYFRVVSGTVYNWRKQGYLAYFQAPGSSKVLFCRDDIEDFKDKYTVSKKGGDKKKTAIKKRKPYISPVKKEWRI